MVNQLFSNLDKVYLAEINAKRIARNLELGSTDILDWCKAQIADPETITKTKDHWHVRGRGFVMVIDNQTYEIVSVRKEKPKKGSNMDDVNIVKKLDDIPELKQKLIAVFDTKTHRRISNYSLLLADHILQLTDLPYVRSIEACYSVNQKWQNGDAKFQEARDVAGIFHDLAREEKNPIKEKALRAFAQVAVTPHVKRHALIASDYVVKLINILHPGDLEEVKKERELQIKLMESI